MSEEELEALLGIGCCEYHRDIGVEAKKEIERLNKIIEDIKKFIKGYDMDLLTYGELEMLRSIELIINGIEEVK